MILHLISAFVELVLDGFSRVLRRFLPAEERKRREEEERQQQRRFNKLLVWMVLVTLFVFWLIYRAMIYSDRPE